MTDRYVDVILSALQKTDTAKVWQQTDLISTYYLGRQCHVIDCVKAVFTHAWHHDIHMAGEYTFSNAVNSDEYTGSRIAVNSDEYTGSSIAVNSDEYNESSIIKAEGECLNAAAISSKNFPVYTKISIYFCGTNNSDGLTLTIAELAELHGLHHKIVPLAWMLKGKINALFAFINDVLTKVRGYNQFFTLQMTLSVNSPTKAAW